MRAKRLGAEPSPLFSSPLPGVCSGRCFHPNHRQYFHGRRRIFTSPRLRLAHRAPHNAVAWGLEDLHYVIKWGVVTAGYSTLSIKDIAMMNGRPAYHIVSEAKSGSVVNAFYKVTDHNEAWLDQESLSSVRYEKWILEGKYHIEETTVIDQPSQRFHLKSYRVDKNLYEQKDGSVPPNVLDVLSSLYYVRFLALEVGHTYTMDVLSGDKVYPLEVKVRKRETIKVPAGKFDTVLVEPLLRGPGSLSPKAKTSTSG